MTKFDEFISNSHYLAKQNRRLKFLKLMEISPTRQDVIFVDSYADLEL